MHAEAEEPREGRTDFSGAGRVWRRNVEGGRGGGAHGSLAGSGGDLVRLPAPARPCWSCLRPRLCPPHPAALRSGRAGGRDPAPRSPLEAALEIPLGTDRPGIASKNAKMCLEKRRLRPDSPEPEPLEESSASRVSPKGFQKVETPCVPGRKGKLREAEK